MREQEFKSSKNAIIISYVIYRWILALMSIGIIALLDYLNYKNTKLSLESKFIVYVTEALTTNSKEIPYEDIKNIRVEQSIIGKLFNYGSIAISMKETVDTIIFTYVNNPEQVRKTVQDKYIRSDKVKFFNYINILT